MRLSAMSITPQPVWRRPGSSPRILKAALPQPRSAWPRRSRRQPCHDLVGDLEVRRDPLNVVVVVERVEQLEHARRRLLVDRDAVERLPDEAGRPRLAEPGLERVADGSEVVDGAGHDGIQTGRASGRESGVQGVSNSGARGTLKK